jgi:hypothetical protein
MPYSILMDHHRGNHLQPSTHDRPVFPEQVFRLPDHSTDRAFPSGPDSGIMRWSFPVTAAGPRRNFTVFPFMAHSGRSESAIV